MDETMADVKRRLRPLFDRLMRERIVLTLFGEAFGLLGLDGPIPPDVEALMATHIDDLAAYVEYRQGLGRTTHVTEGGRIVDSGRVQ
jgi:hypothetical protein